MTETQTISSAGGDESTLSSRRPGPRPKTTVLIPHRQLTQWPPDNIYQMLADRCLAIRQTRQWESRMSPRDTVALCVPYELAHGPADAFIDDHEFCHIHPLPEGSLHLTLPDTLRQQAIENGWAELHPLARTGSLSPSLAMVYAPRNEQELDVVLKLVLASSRFARGV